MREIKYYRGTFNPRYKNKYKGKYPIIWRSKWEKEFMSFLDINTNVLEWASESNPIKYYNPVEKRLANYFPDFFVKFRNVNNTVKQMIVEIKPYKQTIPPNRNRYKNIKTFEYSLKTWLINQEKWKAATDYCGGKKWEFKILTEKNLFI